MMTNQIALVTGATGAIGPTLVDHLIQNGYIVRTLSRNMPDLPHPNTIHYAGSITNKEALAAALDGVSAVFHLAALLHIENPDARLEGQYQQINVEGARLVAENAVKAGVRRMIYFSTVKVYGVRQRLPVPETQAARPQTMYARTKLEGEQAVKSTAGIETVVLRLSPVYGSRLKGSWQRLLRSIRKGQFVPIGNLQNVHSLTHVDDVAQASLLAAKQADAAGKIFNLVGHESPTLYEILGAIYASTGKPMPNLRMPSPLAMIGAFGLEKALGLLGKKSPLSVEALRQLIEDEAYSGASLRSLGFTPQIPLRDGWSADDQPNEEQSHS